jgi:hypothetical protein
MDLDKMIQFMEVFEELNNEQKKWVCANLNHIIERFNEKYNKNITLTF